MAATRNTARTAGIALLAALPLSAQLAVSPTLYANTEAPNANGFPFSLQKFRQQQAHGDLRGQAWPITRMSFRRDQRFGGAKYNVTVEGFMGDTDINRMSSTFSANWLGTPTRVLVKKTLALPDHLGLSAQVPAPFSVVLPFDRQHLYTGSNDLLWEIRVHGNSLGKDTSYFLDSHSGSTLAALGRQRVTGTGCVAPGGRSLNLTNRIETTSTSFIVQWNVRAAPLNAGCLLLVGVNNPNQQLPGWCAGIYSDGQVLIFGKADGFGRFSTGQISLLHNDQGFGTVFHSQAWVFDSAIQPLGIHGSNGLASVASHKARLRRLFASGSATAATGTLNQVNDVVLVTRFN